MARSESRLVLLLPGLFGPQSSLNEAAEPPRAPLLERLLARAAKAACPGGDAVSSLFQQLLPAAEDRCGWPSAAVERHGLNAASDGAYWMHADPVCLKPDMDRLLLFDQRNLDMRSDEEKALIEEINAHFRDRCWRLEATAPGRWYLRLPQAPSITTSPLHQVVGRSVFAFMPRGDEAMRWRGLINEVQMLMYQSPVNEERRQRGLPEINGLWPWGGGRLPESGAGAPVYDRVYADDPLAAGLCRILGIECFPMADLPEAAKQPGAALAYRPDLIGSVLDADAQAWVRGVESLESWLQTLAAAVAARRSTELWLCPCNGEGFRVRPGDKWRIWRRSRPIADYLDKAASP